MRAGHRGASLGNSTSRGHRPPSSSGSASKCGHDNITHRLSSLVEQLPQQHGPPSPRGVMARRPLVSGRRAETLPLLPVTRPIRASSRAASATACFSRCQPVIAGSRPSSVLSVMSEKASVRAVRELVSEMQDSPVEDWCARDGLKGKYGPQMGGNCTEWGRLPQAINALPTAWRGDSRGRNPVNLFHPCSLRVIGQCLCGCRRPASTQGVL